MDQQQSAGIEEKAGADEPTLALKPASSIRTIPQTS